MVTQLKQKKTHSIKIEFSDESVTSFGGLTLAERLASRLGLWAFWRHVFCGAWITILPARSPPKTRSLSLL